MTSQTTDPRLLDLSDPRIRDAVEMSQRFGRDPEYSRGGGGNASVKADGVVYIGDGCQYCGSTGSSYLYAVDCQTGQELWRFEAGGWLEATPAVADGVVYIASGDGHVYAVDNQTGQEKWRFQAESRLFDSPAVRDGVLYAADNNGNLYAIPVR